LQNRTSYCTCLPVTPALWYNFQAHCPSSKRQELQEAEQQNLKEQMMARYADGIVKVLKV